MVRSTYKKEQIFVEDFDRSILVFFEFKIEKVLFRKEQFSILATRITYNNQRLLFPENKVVVKGDFSDPRIGDSYSGIGKVEYQVGRGYSIKLQEIPQIIYPRTRKEVINYLTNKIVGLGQKRATKVYDYFGEDTLKILADNPGEIRQVGIAVTVKMENSLKEVLEDGSTLNQVLSLLNILGIKEDLGLGLVERYGRSTYQELIQNPYILAEVNPVYWRIADQFYFNQLTKNKNEVNYKEYAKLPSRYRTAIKYYLKLKLEMTGSLAYPVQKMIEDFVSGEFLSRVSIFSKIGSKLSEVKIKEMIEDLKTEGEIQILSSGKNQFIYLESSYEAESKIVNLIKEFNRNSFRKSNQEDLDEFIDYFEKENGIQLAERQKMAVDLLPNNKISILVGSAGTGKTSTIKTVKAYLDFLVAKGKIPKEESDICLLAPTGKAADRIAEVLGTEASTIHRKLKLIGFGREVVPEPITESYVIVDESSMIDVYIFSLLLESLSPTSNLLIVGDYEQLPSVGPGLILRDLVESKKVETVRLNKIFRQANGSKLVSNANKIKDGILFQEQEYAPFSKDVLDSFFVETENTFETKRKLIQSVKKLKQQGVEQKDLLILTPVNKGELGTINLNREIQKIYQDTKNEKNEKIIRKSDNMTFYVGDPVIQLINDYDYHVFNGNIGEVSEINIEEGSLETVFITEEGTENAVSYSGGRVQDINLAYSITTHKSQGSESSVVIVLCDQSQIRNLNRSLLYTAVTRARKKVILIGQVDTFDEAVQNISNLERISLIKERL